MELAYITIGFFLIFSWAHLSQKIYSSYATPWAIFGYIWIVSLSLYYSRFFEIQYPTLSVETFLMIYGGLLLAFFAGLFPFLTKSTIRQKKSIKAQIILAISEKHLANCILLTGILGFIGSAASIWIAYRYYGLETLIAKPWITKAGFKTNEIEAASIWNYLESFTFVSSCFAGIYKAAFKKIKSNYYLTIFAIILHVLISWGRFYVIANAILFISSFIVWNYFNNEKLKINSRSFFSILTIFILLCLSFSLIRYIRGAYNLSNDNTLKHYYTYATASIAAFNYCIKVNDGEMFFGAETFHPIAKELKKFGLIDKTPQFMSFDNVFVPVRTNTFTIYRPLYEDFGYTGVLFIPLIISFIMFLWQTKKLKYRILCLSIIPFVYCEIVFSYAANIMNSNFIILSLIFNCFFWGLFYLKGWIYQKEIKILSMP